MIGFCLMALAIAFFISSRSGCFQKHWDKLSSADRQTLDRILVHWDSWVPARKNIGTAPLMTFEEVYSGFGAPEHDFLNRIRAIRPPNKIYLGDIEGVPFKRIEEQWVRKDGTKASLGAQYLPEKVYGAYQNMMRAMEKDLGKRLLVDSGYRSPAYQLYTFLFFMPKHSYSIDQTREWVALPGYSEHGNPAHQAIDFINQQGINGEDNPEEFENLPEYAWLVRRAGEFGFELSYPRGTQGTTFEPWHWRYVEK